MQRFDQRKTYLLTYLCSSKTKAKIRSRMSSIKRSVLYFSKLLSVTNEELRVKR